MRQTLNIAGPVRLAARRLKDDELERLAAIVSAARVTRVRLRRSARWRPVPLRVWKPIAAAIAAHHAITVHQLCFEGTDWKYSVPRIVFWRFLRAFVRRGKPRYSLKAIAAITGHHHTTVLHGLQSKTLDKPSAIIAATPLPKVHHTKAELLAGNPYTRRRHDLTGEIFGQLVITSPAPRPEGKTHYRWWNFRCSCGNAGVTSTGHLGNGKTVCGEGHRAETHIVSHVLMNRAIERSKATA